MKSRVSFLHVQAYRENYIMKWKKKKNGRKTMERRVCPWLSQMNTYTFDLMERIYRKIDLDDKFQN